MLKAFGILIRVIVPTALKSVGATWEASWFTALPDGSSVEQGISLLDQARRGRLQLVALTCVSNAAQALKNGEKSRFWTETWRAVRACPQRDVKVDMLLMQEETSR